ncbi:MAG: protein kinase [Lachnospiraceae bacterium]|nr:protein kinase [Lachnospiraceae bacterium]
MKENSFRDWMDSTEDLETSARIPYPEPEFFDPPIFMWPKRFRNLQLRGHQIHMDDDCRVYSYSNSEKIVMKVTLCQGHPERLQQAENECRTLLALRGRPGILWVYDFEIDREAEAVWLLVEQADPLTKYLEDYQLGLPDVCEIGAGICDAMIQVREAGFRHLDISPDNVFYDAYRHTVRLGDFNAACRIGDADKIDHAVGTPMYMAPERRRDHVCDEASEICSIGLLLYSICNGGLPPFRPESPDNETAFQRRMDGEELPLPQYALKYPKLFEAFVPVLMKACAFRPEDRFKTFEELRDALSAAGFSAYRMHAPQMISACFGEKEGTVLSSFNPPEFPWD